jgi:hypothetical protein
MIRIIAPHHIDTATQHYAAVRDFAAAAPEVPAIRALYSEPHDCWLALEGCHRLAAIEDLGYGLTIVDCSALATLPTDLDWETIAGLTPAEALEWMTDPINRREEGAEYHYDDEDVEIVNA